MTKQPEMSEESAELFAQLRQTINNESPEYDKYDWRDAETVEVQVNETDTETETSTTFTAGPDGTTEEFTFQQETFSAESQTPPVPPTPPTPPVPPAPMPPMTPPPVTRARPVQVGLLVWSGLLIIMGAITLATLVFPFSNWDMVLVGLLVFFGALFLVGAAFSSRSRKQPN